MTVQDKTRLIGRLRHFSRITGHSSKSCGALESCGALSGDNENLQAQDAVVLIDDPSFGGAAEAS